MIEPRRRLRRLSLALLAGCTVVACSTTGPGSSGTPLSGGVATPSAEGSVAMPTPSSSTEPPSAVPSTTPSAEPLGLTSSAFAEGGSIPKKYTCDGTNVSPPLAWAGVPSGAAALILIVDDPDAHGFIHWVAFDIASSGPTGGLADGASTGSGAPRQGTNSFGKVGWGGPCPPSGTHHYRFRLFAVPAPLGLKGAPTADAVLAAIKGHIVAETTLTATYHR